MFLTLFRKECGQILRSLVFYIYVVIFLLFMTSQLGSVNVNELKRPEPGRSYGVTYSKDETAIMERTLADLALDVYHGSFATYPLGFYKKVTLNEQELELIKGYLRECTGKDYEELLYQELADYFEESPSLDFAEAAAKASSYRLGVKLGLEYGQFLEIMGEVCRVVGRGSAYEPSALTAGVRVPRTYEQAVQDYEAMVDIDKVTGSYARLFCDYAGIVLSVFPIFLGVSRGIKDKRSGAADVIYVKPASSLCIIWSRYLANVFMMLLPVLITAVAVQAPYLYHAGTLGILGDSFAFVREACIWLLPEIMIVLALSFLLTEATGGLAGIFVQTAWAIGCLFSARTLVGDFGLKLIVRWNSAGRTLEYLEQRNGLYVNRGYYAVLALVLTLLTVAVYHMKRKGSLKWKKS